MSRLRLFLSDRNGATAIEYALIASLIAMAVFGGVSSTGGQVGVKWGNIATKVVDALSLND